MPAPSSSTSSATRTHATLDGTTTSGGTVAVSASDLTTDTSVAGQLAVGGTAGVGVGADVEVITKDTEATIAPFASVTTTGTGDITVESSSSETMIQVAAGLAIGGEAGVSVNVGVSAISVRTDATIGTHSTAIAAGSVGVTANEALQDDVVTGDIAVGGAAGVGVAAAVPVITKNTDATIGDYATVTGAGGGGGVTVNNGNFTVQGQDTRFNGANVISGNTIDLGYTDGFSTGDTVIYDDGGTGNGTPIGGLTPGNVYFVIVVNPHEVQLADSKCHATGLACATAAATAGVADADRAHPGQRRVAPPCSDDRRHFARRRLAALRSGDRRRRLRPSAPEPVHDDQPALHALAVDRRPGRLRRRRRHADRRLDGRRDVLRDRDGRQLV